MLASANMAFYQKLSGKVQTLPLIAFLGDEACLVLPFCGSLYPHPPQNHALIGLNLKEKQTLVGSC